MYDRAVECRWEVHPDEPAAVRREADLLVALQPAYNAAASIGGWSDVAVDTEAGRIRCGTGLSRAGYGVFPHLGPSGECSEGYLALLRLLWATGRERPYPAALARRAPPADLDVPLPEARRRPLHDFLVGTSRRLLEDLARTVEDVDPVRRPALRRDLTAAEAFFAHGTARLRDLRRRHGLGTRHVTRREVSDALLDEVRRLLGDDVHLPVAPDPKVLGARSARSLRRTTGLPPDFGGEIATE